MGRLPNGYQDDHWGAYVTVYKFSFGDNNRQMKLHNHKMFIPLLAFVTTIIMMQAPWFGLLATVPFVSVTSRNM